VLNGLSAKRLVSVLQPAIPAEITAARASRDATRARDNWKDMIYSQRYGTRPAPSKHAASK
jgi:hypothetical protein